MSGHLPSLDLAALWKLRRLVRSIQSRQGAAVPMRELVALSHEARMDAGVTVDFGATRELGEPMIVVRVPEQRTGAPPRLEMLTRREREVATLVATGLANKQIAARLDVTTATVKDHVHNILEKTGLSNRAAIAAAAVGEQR